MNRARLAVLLSTVGLWLLPGSAFAQMQNPHTSTVGQLAAQANVSAPDSNLPPGSVTVQVLDGGGAPVPGADVQLIVSHESVAEGSSENTHRRKSDADGKVRFDGLPTGSGYSFRASVDRPPARYATDLFALGRDRGHKVVLHVFPATSDIEDTMVAGQLLVYLEPREDLFQVSILLELFNVGQTTWVPSGTGFRFPEGWKGFEPQDSDGTLGLEPTGGGINLVGSVGPGQHNATFSVQVPREESTTASLNLGLPPRMAVIRVMMESGPLMQLEVKDFPAARATLNRDQKRVLVTQAQAGRGSTPTIDRLDIRVSGLTTRGNGRWISLWLALGIAGIGVSTAVRGQERRGKPGSRDIAQAREVLFAELVEVEQALHDGRIGPQTHRQVKQTLIDALTRLEVLSPRSGDQVGKRASAV